MNLLVITQKVDINDDNLGFFLQWLEKLSLKTDKLFVICLSKGRYNLPANVEVFSLGKERGTSKIERWFLLQKHLLKCLPQVNAVFVHMCPIYAILSCPMAKLFHQKLVLWFVHKSVSFALKVANWCVDKILTASQESCRLKNRTKIQVVGHGIDTEKFSAKGGSASGGKRQSLSQNSKLHILSAGRISPVKDQETLIKAVDILVHQQGLRDLQVEFIGSPVEKYEKDYFSRLKSLVKQKSLEQYIIFSGGAPYQEMPAYYQTADIAVNLSHTGSLDKAVLEAMACGCKVLTCNEAYARVLPEKYLFKKKDYQHLAEQIIALKDSPPDESLREIVVKNHNLDNLIDKIILEFKN